MKNKHMTIIVALIFVVINTQLLSQNNFININIEAKIDSILELMTLDEKIGQLNLYSAATQEITGPIKNDNSRADYYKRGMVGAVLHVTGVKKVYELQKFAVEKTRLGIPLLFALDVVHGYRTIFPIPLAESCSWDLDAIEKSARISAIEATAAGLNWTFAPMVDIARDPRWGRVMEGAGEDPFLGAEVAKASIRGFQGDDLSDSQTLLACAKHFVAYGASEGGRDYNTVDMSKRVLNEVYLKPFKAANDVGVATFMTSFIELDGVPATTNKYLLKEILRNRWHFNGFVVSDWGAIVETINHGTAKNKYESAIQAMNAGCDMDMEASIYIEYLKNAVLNGDIDESKINTAVRRVLRMKFLAGLFDNPYKYLDEERESRLIYTAENREASRDMARKSIVLLKNSKHILPLKKTVKSIAVIGALANSKADMNGSWSAKGKPNEPVTLLEGIRATVSNSTKVLYAKSNSFDKISKSEIINAIKIAKQADITIVTVGESARMSGEAACRAYLNLPGNQFELLLKLKETGKPIIIVLMNGRPLVIPEIDENFDTILETWWLGSEAGNAIADVIFGDYNPSGKLTMSFPYAVGQIPVYYNHKNTGRPKSDEKYTSKYLDIPNEPLYPFGYGLSYTSFNYSDITLSSDTLKPGKSIVAYCNITNTGNYYGEEVVQLYIQDLVASVTRPVKELKGFKKIKLKKGETTKIEFSIVPEMLSFFTKDMTFKTEPGEFKLFIGSNSQDTKETNLFYNE